MIAPIVIIGVGLAGLGGTAYWLRKWAMESDVPGPLPGPVPVPDPDDPDPDPYDGGGAPHDPSRCSRAGERYDAGRWSSPMHVAAGLIALGYMVGTKLTTSSDKKQIKKFQADAIALRLHGLEGAALTSKNVDGKMGACTLLALSAAESRLKAGKWIVRTPTNWFDKNWLPAMKAAAGG